MKVSPADQKQLLELQATDLQLSRLKHQVDTHQLRSKLEELGERSDDLHRSILAQQADLADRKRKITNLAEEIRKLAERRDLQQERLETGKVPLRDMSAVENEIGQINRRKDDLEYELLEDEEALEERDRFLAETEKTQEALKADETATTSELEQALVEPRAEIARLEGVRADLRDALPPQVIDEYDYYRSRMGMLVVLAYEDGHLKDAPFALTGAEESALNSAPEDELWQSVETNYFVVRV